eukprot:2791713-Rhodomonas_salina.1
MPLEHGMMPHGGRFEDEAALACWQLGACQAGVTDKITATSLLVGLTARGSGEHWQPGSDCAACLV